jgi:hypothetical protein
MRSTKQRRIEGSPLSGRYSPRHDSSWSANEFTVNILDRTPPDQPIQSHQHQRDPMAKAGPSRLPREAPKPSGSPPIARIWGRPSRDDPASGANSINISQADPSPDSRNFREDLEQTHPIDDVQAAECSVSPATIEQGQIHRRVSIGLLAHTASI